MIITRLVGGLGNQMFQYALGRALSLQNKDTLKLDITSYRNISTNKYSIRKFDLEGFNIINQIATDQEIENIKHPLGRVSYYWNRIYRRIFIPSTVPFIPKVLKKKGNIYLDGYWQSEQYFSSYADIIRSDFTPKTPLQGLASDMLSDIHGTKISVGLHIRRGDNAYNSDSIKAFGMPPTSYYLDAIQTISEKLHTQDIHLYIFSDDVQWVKESMQFPLPSTIVSQSGIKDWQEILLMAACDHTIISNSTFSWWGAWLNNNPSKIVIAPRHWANVNIDQFRDLIPENWMRI